MKQETWHYYNHAAIPTCARNEEPNFDILKSGAIWNGLGGGENRYLRGGPQTMIVGMKLAGGI